MYTTFLSGRMCCQTQFGGLLLGIFGLPRPTYVDSGRAALPIPDERRLAVSNVCLLGNSLPANPDHLHLLAAGDPARHSLAVLQVE